ncbi:CMRF35-like molecule 1 [Otolemur garnettii]|uniref:CMRF35-like molecule 1 n=1 Tax=Otolemur garnettii TaxID=30611 RepID=UPI000C7F04E1|nr:CMRF35-like molecule 1 [Otolemur garnettii]
MHLPTLLLFLWLSGSLNAEIREDPITGPGAVSGPEGGSLTVQCCYNPEWRTHKKWWCRGADWGPCKILVETTGTEEEVKKDRVSIRDSWKDYTFNVTMEALRRDDADTYWCGIERTGIDKGVQVKVTIDPDPGSMCLPLPHTGWVGSGSGAGGESGVHGPPPVVPRLGITRLSILLPLIFAIVLLLLVAISLLAWRVMKKQKKASGVSPEQALQPLEGEICYANLTLQQNGASSNFSRKKASVKPPSASQVEVEYVTMHPVPRQEVSYASLSFGILDQEPTYSNTGQHTTHVSGGSHQELTEYSTVRRP